HSNFRIVGFTEAPALADLARLAHARALPLVYDLGSGSPLATESFGVAHEPTPRESIRAGADVVCFSGDKLLGGPQAGLIVGAGALLATIARHPLMRAVRIDKLTLAALEATLRIHRDGLAQCDLPVWQAIARPLDAIGERAQHWVAVLADIGVSARVEPGETSIGGGSLPGETLPTMLCVIDGFAKANEATPFDAAALARRLRMAATPVVGRVYRDHLYLDPRTVTPREDVELLAALREAFTPA
ncbi:MAG: aminotransferase class V-fold PLP-dependent enzyme, partial [Ktedonobacterales bacterium]